MAKDTVRIMAGAPQRDGPYSGGRHALLRGLHVLHPQLSETPLRYARASKSLEYLEICSHRQIGDILAAESRDLAFRNAARKSWSFPTGFRVFLIEDEALLVMDLCQAITDAGNTVSGVARTRAEAEHKLDPAKSDLVIVDIKLADGSSGVSAVRPRARNEKAIPAIFLTGTPQSILNDEPAEPAYVLEKPTAPEQLLCMMALALCTEDA